jgi:hypothetical protein
MPMNGSGKPNKVKERTIIIFRVWTGIEVSKYNIALESDIKHQN